MHVLHVVGTRPNFMKVAPVLAALAKRGNRQTLVHTGQHYDANMSDAIFRELQIPEPDINLGIGSGSHAQQTGQVLMRMEEVLLERKPDWLLVYGDVNSTLAASLAASKIGIPVAHVEAGLRSGDRTMPEEINRIVTDRLASLLLTPSPDGDANLLAEGVPAEWIQCVGNVMIDTLIRLLPQAESLGMLERLSLTNGHGARRFALVTLHRPSNVDDSQMLVRLIAALDEVARDIPVLFPMHPRTRARMASAGIAGKRLTVLDPLTYLEFLGVQKHAALVITDSGGIQEETTYLGVPCLTMRENTERPITVTTGTNQLIGRDTELMKVETRRILDGTFKQGAVPPLWDGLASERIAERLYA
ncbi:MAG TPA: UDP-N-acetylglucosamine 2-epimerase (non-hydrolyzing) [Gemmatimonadaceae bacterium]|nr:UDP-N-acetylglucosamine 2-epimerase (non-hydrolyzing) [Gemmatimonadaceae bacterium]